MPRIVCHTCGREVYTTAPVEQLFQDERRCPRCGAPLSNDRREEDRRQVNRRQNPPDEPGAPGGVERRLSDRRSGRRRQGGGSGRNSGGWLE